MTVSVQVIPARASHIRTIAARMREADRQEVWAASKRTPAGALAYSLRKSTHAWTVMINGRPEVMLGVADLNVLTGTGAVWLLGTDAVAEHYRIFLRHSANLRDQLLSRYRVLRNFVDERNTVSVRWLRWLGCEFSDPVVFNGYSFRMFELRSKDV